MADDKNKASAYFKPVVESAKKVLSGCKSKEELGREMGKGRYQGAEKNSQKHEG